MGKHKLVDLKIPGAAPRTLVSLELRCVDAILKQLGQARVVRVLV